MQNKIKRVARATGSRAWQRGIVASAAALVMAGASFQAHALALGAANVRSALGEPLRAEIEIPQISSEEAAAFRAQVASPAAFRAAGVEYTPALQGARVTLHRRANGQAYLRVVGDRPVNEPFLGVVIEASWGTGRVVRDYTMLLDPPGRRESPAVTAQPQIAAAPMPAPVLAPQPVPAAPAPMAAPAAGVAEQTTAPAAQPRSTVAARERAGRYVQRGGRAAAPAEAAPRGDGQQVTVQRGNTASSLAQAHMQPGVSLDQMLAAMIRQNPSAFIKGNVNLIRSGAVIDMPSTEQAGAISQREARRVVVAHSRNFQGYRSRLARSVPRTAVASAGRTSGGSVQAQVSEAQAAAPASDRLTISRGSVGGASGTGAAARTETKVAQSRQAQEQTERVAELSRNINELNKLQGASGAGAAKPATPAPAPAATTPSITVPSTAATKPAQPAPAPAPAPVVVAPPAPVPAPAPVVVASAPAADAAATAAVAAAASAASGAGAAVSSAASAASAAAGAVEASASAASAAVAAASAADAASRPAPVRKPVVVPPPPPEPSFLDELMENPLIPAAGVGLLALLGGFGFYKARQRKKNAASLDSSFIESRLQPDSFFGASGGQQVNTKDGGSSVSGNSSMAYSPSQLDAAGDVDPVAEADVYLAYGRDMQAEEILKEALRTQPTRVSVHRKLAEIYAKRRDVKALEALAVDAWGVTRGTGADWDFIADLGAELDPANPLYKPGGTPASLQQAKAPPARPAGFGADTVPRSSQQPLDSKAPDSKAAALDFDLSLDDAPVKPAAAPVSAKVAAAGAAAGAALATGAAALRPSAPPPPARPAPAPVVEDPKPLDFDLDLNLGPTTAPSPVAPPVAMPSLDLPTIAVPPAAAPKVAAPAVKAAAPASGANSGMIEFDLDALSSSAESRAGNLKTEQPDDADEDPLGTKLSLAQEFHAIGDTEGARALVKEVIAEASEPMRSRAERLLAEMT